MKTTNAIYKNIKFGTIEAIQTLTSFRYVKFEVTANNGNTITTVGDLSYVVSGLEYPNTAMTGFNSPTPYSIVSYSSYYNTDPIYEPWKAFDNQTGTNNRWLFDGTFPQHVTVDLGTTFNLSDLEYVKILPGNHNVDDYTTRAIKDFNVSVSDDNIEWVTVLTETNVTNWSEGVTKNFFIT